jgi:uncharacterized protein YkwD
MSARWVAVTLAAVACAAGPRPPAASRPRLAAARVPAEAAAVYGDEREVTLSGVERDAAAALRQGAAAPAISPALVRAARALARRAAAGEASPLAPRYVRAALADAGAYDPAPLARIASGAAARLPALLADPADAGATHVGVGAAVAGESTFVVALTARRSASIVPFPRRVPAGSAHRLRGRLTTLSGARVVLTSPSGVARQIAASPGATFDATIRFEEAGSYVVEVVGAGPRGPEVAALLPVLAGGGPEAPTVAPHAPSPDPHDLAAAEERVIAALNALRARQGLAPVAASPALRAIARRHSADMAAHGEVAHVLPGTGDLAARLRRGGVGYRRAVENVARAATGLEAHEVAAESPAHRANMLDPAVKLAGVGIARTRAGAGEPVVYLTQILIDPAARRGTE